MLHTYCDDIFPLLFLNIFPPMQTKLIFKAQVPWQRFLDISIKISV